MEEEVETTEEEESIWDIMGMDEPEEYAEESEDADAEVAKENKMEKKLSAKMDDMQKKFEQTIMRERITKFEESADDLQKDLFKTIAAEVKDVESLDKAMTLVNERSKKLREEEERYKAQLEQQVQEQVAQAWGTGPMGTPSPHTKDEEEQILQKIAAGDVHALYEDLMRDNWPG